MKCVGLSLKNIWSHLEDPECCVMDSNGPYNLVPLYGLPVCFWVQFKVLLPPVKSFNEQSIKRTVCLPNICQWYQEELVHSGSHQLRSVIYWDHTVMAPAAGNSILPAIHISSYSDDIPKVLKTGCAPILGVMVGAEPIVMSNDSQAHLAVCSPVLQFCFNGSCLESFGV